VSDILKKCIRAMVLTPIRRYYHRFLGLWLWMSPAMRQVFRATPTKERRLLIIHDFSAQPFSVGEMLVSQEGSLVLRERYGAVGVDIAILYNRQSPVADPIHKLITEDNVLFNLAAILPVAQVNPYFGSVFVFDSRDRLERFVLDTSDLYTVWPDARSFMTKKYVNYEVMNNILYPYFKKNGRIPTISCTPFLVKWASDFYQKHVCPNVGVSIQVRNNPFFHQQRNLNTERWLDLFQYCSSRYPVTFVLIGIANEIDARFRGLNNVLIAKDFHTGLDQDLALIQMSAIHMGSSSGPNAMAIFSPKPFLFVRDMTPPEAYLGMVKEGKFWRMPFSTPYQLFYSDEETTELLICEFERMWTVVYKEPWTTVLKEDRETVPESWLR
jgi:hypothetical protein